MNLTNLDLQERANFAVVCTGTKHWDKHSELSELRKPNEGVADCPNCGSYLQKTGASFCMHCRNELVWFDGLVKAVGQLPRAEIMNQVDRAEQERSKFLFTSPSFWFGLILLMPCILVPALLVAEWMGDFTPIIFVLAIIGNIWLLALLMAGFNESTST